MRTTATITIEDPPRIYKKDFIQFMELFPLREAIARWETEVMSAYPNTDYELTVEESYD